MSLFSSLLHCDGRTDRLTYQRNVALLVAAKLVADSIVLSITPNAPSISLVAYGWLNPFALIEPWFHGEVPLLICASTLLFFTTLVWNSVHRTRDTGYAHWLGLLAAIPFISPLVAFALAFLPPRKRSVWDII